jgi:hypothetical protein
MEITKVRISRNNVHLEYNNEGDTYKYDSKDKPLPSFYKAVDALAPVICSTLGLPKSYVGKKPTEGDTEPGLPLRPTGLTITTKGESRMVTLVGQKTVSTSPSPFNIATPLRYMDAPTEEGACSEPYGTKDCAIIEEVIEEARKYLRGERAQGQLPLEEEPAQPSEPSDGNTLEFPGTEPDGTED